jgi:hypothetical protein
MPNSNVENAVNSRPAKAEDGGAPAGLLQNAGDLLPELE